MIWKKTISEKMHKNQFCKMMVMNNIGRFDAGVTVEVPENNMK